MRTLSASEAITPAINRTKVVLFQPFQKGRSWKLAATAYLTVMGSVFLPTPLALLANPRAPGQTGAVFALVALSIGGVLSALMFLLFYAGARLQFVLFDIVLRREKMVAPLWRRYGRRTWRWIGLKLALSLIFIVVSGVPLLSGFRYLMANMPSAPGQPPPPEFIGSFFLIYGILLFSIFIVMLCSSLLNDFVLPPIALEDTTLVEAMRRFGELLKAEPGQVVFYVFLKAVLAIAGFIAMEVSIVVAELVALIPLGIIAFLGWLALHSLGQVGQVLLIAGGVVLFLIFVAFLFYVGIGITGCVIIFFQAYALYFLGGRYPLLGDLLEPLNPDFAFATPPSPDLPPPPSPMMPPTEPVY